MSELTWTDEWGQTRQIEPSRDWVNYGDVNPLRHGGMWVKWTGDHWEVIRTTPPEDLPEDMAEGEHYVQLGWVDPVEVWLHGDPENGPTSQAERFIDRSGRYDCMAGLLVDGSVSWLIPEFIHYRGTDRYDLVHRDEIEDYLTQRGVDL